MTSKIRFAKKSDAKRILELYNSTQNLLFVDSPISAYNKKEILEYILKKDNRLVVFEENKSILGSILGEFHSDYVYLHSVVVDPAFRGKGIGRQLVEYLFKLAKKEKKLCVEALTERNNLGMKKIFEKLNFKKGKDFIAYQKAI